MVTIKLRQLLGLRNSSSMASINSGSSDHYDVDDNNIQDAHNNLAASIANRELLLTAAAMKHTNNSSSEDTIRVLSNEIHLLRDEMRERFNILEKKFIINFNNNSVHNVDVSMDSEVVYKEKGDTLEEETVKLVSPGNRDKLEAEDGTSNEKVVLSGMPIAVGKDDLKRVKRNKLKKKQAKGKRRQKKNKTASSVSSAVNPSGYGTLTILVSLVNAIPTLILMRGGKRLYMLLVFIAASYLFKGEMNSFSSILNDDSVGDDISTSIGGWFSIGNSFSFIRGVRALEDCPEQYVVDNIDTYEIGSKVTIEEKVYECTESPCGWKMIGTCVVGMFQPNRPAKSSLGRVRTHSTGKTRQGLFGDDDSENTQATLYYPDYVLAKCVIESSTIFDSSQSSATIEECCDQW